MSIIFAVVSLWICLSSMALVKAWTCAFHPTHDSALQLEYATCWSFGSWCQHWLRNHPQDPESTQERFTDLQLWFEHQGSSIRFGHSRDRDQFSFGLSPESFCDLFIHHCCAEEFASPAGKAGAIVRTSNECPSCLESDPPSTCQEHRCMWIPSNRSCVPFDNIQHLSAVTDISACELKIPGLRSLMIQGKELIHHADADHRNFFIALPTMSKEIQLRAEATSALATIDIDTSSSPVGRLAFRGLAMLHLNHLDRNSYPTLEIYICVTSLDRQDRQEYVIHVIPADGSTREHEQDPRDDFFTNETTASKNGGFRRKEDSNRPKFWLGWLPILGVLLVILFGAVTFCYYRRVAHQRLLERPSDIHDRDSFWSRTPGIHDFAKCRDDDSQTSGTVHASPTELLEEWNIEPENIKIGKSIGIGASAEVFEGFYCDQLVAIKRFYHSEVVINQFQDFFESEARILTSLHHPNVVQFYGIVRGFNRLYLITEYCPQTLAQVVQISLVHQSSESWQASQFFIYSLSIAHGLSFLHTKKTVHGDVKPENVLIHQDGSIKICDFGLSHVVISSTDEGASMNRANSGACGTPAYLAPEIISCLSFHFDSDAKRCFYISASSSIRTSDDSRETVGCSNFKSDVYAFGMMLYYLWTRKSPYEESLLNTFQLLEQVQQHGLRPCLFDTLMPPALVLLIQKCWDDRPSTRPWMHQVCQELKAIAGPTFNHDSFCHRLSITETSE